MKDFIKVQIPPSAAGKILSLYLAESGYPISADCGGRGSCGKCRVQVISGNFYADSRGEELLLPDENKQVRSCKAWCTSESAEILLPISKGSGLAAFSGSSAEKEETFIENEYGIALDVGTTTLAAALVETKTAKLVKTISCLNPQRSFGADVMSRISASDQGNLQIMQEVLLREVGEMVAKLTCSLPSKNIKHMAVAGNTTMLHLFCGISPTGMGVYPFTPAFIDMKTLPGYMLKLPVETIHVLPSVSAFIGGDVTAGMFALKLIDEDEPTVLMDIGTNGEMVLFTGKKHGGKLFAASAAAGPAMEGADISSGVGGIGGAVCQVFIKDGNICCKTIGDLPPVGICGSGLIDLVAVLLRTGKLDETGYLEEEQIIYAEGKNGELSLTQDDIRAFQLAKSAIRAGLEALVAAAGLSIEQINKICLAGGLGYYMNVQSAVEVGLLPECAAHKVESVGNSALGGAAAFLRDPVDGANTMSELAAICETVDLNFSSVFQDGFIEYMMF